MKKIADSFNSTKVKMIRSFLWFGLTFLVLLINEDLLLPMDEATGTFDSKSEWYAIGLVVMTVAALLLNVYRALNLYPVRERNRYIRPWQAVPAILMVPVFFLEIELINNPIFDEMENTYIIMNLIVWLFVTVVLLLLLNNLNLTFEILLVFTLVVSLVFYFVYLFRGEAFQLIDLNSLGTAAEVAGGYSYTLTQKIVWWICGTMNLMAFWDTAYQYKITTKYLRFKIIIRIIAVELAVAGYCYYSEINWNAEYHVISNLWNPEKTYQSYGTTVGCLAVAKYMRLSEPDNYSIDEVENVEAEIEEKEASGDDDLRKDNADGVTPVNLICIMNESWFDYRNIGTFTTDQETMPFLDSVTDNIIKGYTLVCTKGGGTAKTEYEFLTGNSCKRFPGLVPYVCYFTHDQYSLVTTMKDQGYTAIAMHPNKATNWKRDIAYRYLQFDDFISIDDFDSDVEKYRNMVSDQANYEKIVETYENKEPGEKLFLFDVTMQNHSGYEHENFIPNVHLTDYDSSQADEYFTLLRMSDEAIEYLLTYFSNVDEPTMIVMYGDHSPKLPDDFETWLAGSPVSDLSVEEQEKFYDTPFFIWTNYDMESESDVQISTNYLSSYVLSLTGLEMTDYNDYLLEMREEIPALNHIGYEDSDGTWHTWEDASEEALAKENEYEILQYNNLIEKGDRVNTLFSLSAEDDN